MLTAEEMERMKAIADGAEGTEKQNKLMGALFGRLAHDIIAEELERRKGDASWRYIGFHFACYGDLTVMLDIEAFCRDALDEIHVPHQEVRVTQQPYFYGNVIEFYLFNPHPDASQECDGSIQPSVRCVLSSDGNHRIERGQMVFVPEEKK